MNEDQGRPRPAGPRTNDTTVSVLHGGDDWRERLAEWQAGRERRAAARAAFTEARRRGLAARHARKLARTRGGRSP